MADIYTTQTLRFFKAKSDRAVCEKRVLDLMYEMARQYELFQEGHQSIDQTNKNVYRIDYFLRLGWINLNEAVQELKSLDPFNVKRLIQ